MINLTLLFKLFHIKLPALKSLKVYRFFYTSIRLFKVGLVLPQLVLLRFLLVGSSFSHVEGYFVKSGNLTTNQWAGANQKTEIEK